MHSPKKILLALDTSTRVIGIALYDGAQIIHESVWASHDHHTVELAPAVKESLRKSGLTTNDLCALGVAMGPGSFTGLRIGLALAKGISLVQRLPIVGIPTLDILATSQPLLDIPMAAVLRAGRGRLAVNWYQVKDQTWQPVDKLEVLTPFDLKQRIQTKTLVCGELTAEERLHLTKDQNYITLASPARSLRRPSYLAELAWNRWQAGKIDNPATLAPIYLHYNDPIPG